MSFLCTKAFIVVIFMEVNKNQCKGKETCTTHCLARPSWLSSSGQERSFMAGVREVKVSKLNKMRNFDGNLFFLGGGGRRTL